MRVIWHTVTSKSIEEKLEEGFSRGANHAGIGAGIYQRDDCWDLSKADGVAAKFLSLEEKGVAMERTEIRRLKQFEEENSKLKRLVADLSLYKTILTDALRKKFEPSPTKKAGLGCACDIRDSAPVSVFPTVLLSVYYAAGLMAKRETMLEKSIPVFARGRNLFSMRNLRLVRKHAVRSLNGLKFGISAKGRTAHLIISAPKRSRRPGELVRIIVCPLKVGKSTPTPIPHSCQQD